MHMEQSHQTSKLEAKVIDMLDKLSEQLGTTGAELWQVLIAQAHIVGMVEIGSLIFVVVVAIAVVGCMWYLSVGFRKQKDNGALCWTVFIAFMVGILVVIIVSANMREILTCFYNPEYWALHQILDTF